MQQQKLCLKWNNHTANLLEVLGTFRQTDILVDVTISCEGRNIKAHKMVLSACSPYFQNIFLENPCQHPIVIINGMKYEDVTAILNFMYKGEVNVSHDGLSSFLQAAEALKVRGLAEVCGDKNSASQESEQPEQSQPQRAETPNKKRHRNRKRSLSDSNKSDDEGAVPRKQKDINSPEVHDLSGDEAFTGDTMSSNGQLNSRLRQNTMYSRSHQSSNVIVEEMEDEYEVEPTKLLEQTLTENVSMNNSTSSDNLRIEQIMGNATEMESSSLQEPESPPDIKPIIEYGESSSGPSEGNILPYNEQSQPGPSSVQDSSLLHDNSHTQDTVEIGLQSMFNHKHMENNDVTTKKINLYKCRKCKFKAASKRILKEHLKSHGGSQSNKMPILKKKKKVPAQKPEQVTKTANFKCYFCVYETTSEHEISNHLHSHEYICTRCKKSFSSLENLNEHKLKAKNNSSNDIKEDKQKCPEISSGAPNAFDIETKKNSVRPILTRTRSAKTFTKAPKSVNTKETSTPKSNELDDMSKIPLKRAAESTRQKQATASKSNKLDYLSKKFPNTPESTKQNQATISKFYKLDNNVTEIPSKAFKSPKRDQPTTSKVNMLDNVHKVPVKVFETTKQSKVVTPKNDEFLISTAANSTSYTNETMRNSSEKSEKNVSGPHICFKCNKHFSGLEELQLHSKTHRVGLYTCELCNTDFAAMYGLESHRAIIHPTLQCTVCQQLFENSTAHDEHMKMHFATLNDVG